MKTKTHFAFRVDVWDDKGDSIVEHVAGADDFEVAEATYCESTLVNWADDNERKRFLNERQRVATAL
jgi:hypothetical protein